MPTPPPIAPALVRWFRAAARPFPWRDAPHGSRDPWRVLVSEIMAQQTQIARVAQRFPGFLRQFPSPAAMAAVPESRVLAAWAGLGYYRRARNLHRAARVIGSEHAGVVPADPALLRRLPGVGPYTAGAVASLAFGVPAPVVDGNVARVLLRLHAKPLRADDPRAVRWTWAQARAMVTDAAERRIPPGELNEALMELGATVCTPAAPRCRECPLARVCETRRAGKQAVIPRPKSRPAARRLGLTCLVLTDPKGRVLMERAAGLWEGLWQPITYGTEWSPAPPHPDAARAPGWIDAGAVTRTLSHRRVRFRVWAGLASQGVRAAGGRRWIAPRDFTRVGVSAAHLMVVRAGLDALAATGSSPRPPRGSATSRRPGQRSRRG